MELVHERRGAGEPLVLLHGIGSRWQVFAPVLDDLAADFEVWAVDMPGFGASPPAAPPITSIPDLAERIATWMAARHIEGGHVAGSSTGGAVALELAARGLVASATALAPVGFYSSRERAFLQASLRGTRALSRATRPTTPIMAGSAVGRTLAFSQYYARPWRVTPEEVMGGVDALLGATAFDDVASAFTGYVVPESAADRVPVTICWGGRDRLLLPRQAERARRRLPRARHVLLPHVGHVMMSDDPEAVADVIRAGTRAPVPV